MQRGIQIALMVGIVIMAGLVAFLYFRQIPNQIARNTEPVYTVATLEPSAVATLAPQVGSQTASIKTTADLNATSNNLDQIDFNQFDKELTEVDF